jgi:hypothetical protein
MSSGNSSALASSMTTRRAGIRPRGVKSCPRCGPSWEVVPTHERVPLPLSPVWPGFPRRDAIRPLPAVRHPAPGGRPPSGRRTSAGCRSTWTWPPSCGRCKPSNSRTRISRPRSGAVLSATIRRRPTHFAVSSANRSTYASASGAAPPRRLRRSWPRPSRSWRCAPGARRRCGSPTRPNFGLRIWRTFRRAA